MKSSESKQGLGKRAFYFVFSLAVTLGVFSYLFTYISPGEVINLIKNADRRGVLMFIILSLSMSALRAWRYQILLGLSGYAPSFLSIMLVVLVGNFFSDLLPARLGTLIYVYIITTRLGVPFAAAASSFALAFLFELVTLGPLIMVIAWAVGAETEIPLALLVTSGLLVAAISVVLIAALPSLCGIATKLVGHASFLSEARSRQLLDAVRSTREEIEKTKRAGLYSQLLVVSFAIRIVRCGALYMFLYALLHPIGYEFGNLSVPRVFLGVSASEAAASVPFAGIAGFGIYEGTWSIVFELLGFEGSIAKLTSISHHLFVQVWGYMLGAISLMVLLLPMFRRELEPDSRAGATATGGSFFLRLAGALSIMTLLLLAVYHLPMETTSPREPDSLAENAGNREILRAISSELPGRIVFDSNRSGSFGIFSTKTDGSDLLALVDTELEEMYPDPSPDGRFVVYGASRFLHRQAASDVWLFDRGTQETRLLIRDGTFPTFSSDGEWVYFERKRARALRVRIDGTGEEEIFPAGNRDFGRFDVVKPRVSPDGRLVAFISDKGGRWNTWYAELQGERKLVHVGEGCEPGWFSDSLRIAWIREKGVEDRSGVFVFDLRNQSRNVLQDAGPPRGHEYFPTVVAGDRFLLYGSSREEEHDHMRANYQLFVKDLVTGSVARLTHDPYTNRWPKVLSGYGG